jgi:2-polyprenyl-6-methoxyphenol hydroxylase-like FAD-dependent oxidoreductase
MTNDTGVLVSGGGIGGLALGIALRLARIDVTVVERTASSGDRGSGLVLYPNGMKALAAISAPLNRAVLAAGHVARPGESKPLVNPAGEVLSVDRPGQLAQRYGAPQVSLLRTALRGALLDEATRTGTRVLTGVRVVGHADCGDHVAVRLADGTSLSAAALVGADGLNSGVRRRLLADGPPRYCGYTTLRGRSGAAERYPHGVIATGPGAGLFIAPVGGGGLYWTAKLSAPAGVWPAKDQAGALADLLRVLAGWHQPIVDIIAGTDVLSGVVVTDISDREPVACWTVGRVTLLGDAAHPMSPGAGQGASMALEDAVVLAGLLRENADVPAALGAYSRRRGPRTARVVRQSRERDTVVRSAGSDAPIGGTRRGEATSGGPGARAPAREFSTQDEQLADLFGWQAEPGSASIYARSSSWLT